MQYGTGKPNVENLTKLIDHLKKVNKANFDMAHWIERQNIEIANNYTASEIVSLMEKGENKCNTVGCIAGHALLMSLSEEEDTNVFNFEYDDVEWKAASWLNLNYDQAKKLFQPESTSRSGWGSIGIRLATLPKVIAVLEKLRATANDPNPKIDWRTPIKKETEVVAI